MEKNVVTMFQSISCMKEVSHHADELFKVLPCTVYDRIRELWLKNMNEVITVVEDIDNTYNYQFENLVFEVSEKVAQEILADDENGEVHDVIIENYLSSFLMVAGGYKFYIKGSSESIDKYIEYCFVELLENFIFGSGTVWQDLNIYAMMDYYKKNIDVDTIRFPLKEIKDIIAEYSSDDEVAEFIVESKKIFNKQLPPKKATITLELLNNENVEDIVALLNKHYNNESNIVVDRVV